MNKSCFTEQDLRNYALGTSDDATTDEIERHLAECPVCEETLAGFDDSADTLMRHLPLAVGALSEGPSAAVERPNWLEQLRGGPPAAAGAVPDPIVGPVATPLALRALNELSAYELLGVLGHGGMGIVYRARHRQLNRVVALKVLHPRLTATFEARQRFEREIRILGSMQHQGVVMATDAGRIGPASYLVMEFIDGVDLAQLVRRSGPLSVAEACAVGREIADALSAAHRAGAVHRDVKPSNVMIDRAGRIKLLDFGLAQLATLSADDPETSLGQLLGTLEYMAPEQARPEGPVDLRVDVYGLGATLFFLLAGRSPRGTGARRSLLDQLRSLSEDPPYDVRSLRSDVPPELADLTVALLSRDPACRPASADEVAIKLSEWSGGNLAARVADVAATSDEGRRPDDRDAADRSLLQQLGIVADGSPAGPGAVAGTMSSTAAGSGEQPGWRIIRRIAGLIALAACAAAIWFGVTIFLETPNGTLRIESEVADVRVEVIDEKDQARELTIDRNERETVLRAGKYRVRLTGDHDGLAITPEVITLRQGKREVAKITRLPGGTAVADLSGNAANQLPQPTAAVGRLFKGEPEAVWQQRFNSEIDAEAKIAAAQALVTLASELPPDKRIDRIVSIGAVLLEAAGCDDVLQLPVNVLVPSFHTVGPNPPGFANVLGSGARNRTPRGSGQSAAGAVMPAQAASDYYLNSTRWPYSTALGSAWKTFLDLVDRELRQVPAIPVAERLGQAIAGGNASECSFAALLVACQSVGNQLKRDPSAVERLVAQLTVDVRGLDRTALAVLLRARFADKSGIDAQRQTTAAMNDLASRLLDSAAGDLRSRMIAAWLYVAPYIDVDPKARAALVYERLAVNPRTGFAYDFLPMQFHFRFPYRVTDRPQDDSFLAACISEANRRLAAAGKDERTIDTIIQSFDYLLRFRLPTDQWDVETTARLLTDRLRQYYSGDAAGTIAVPEPAAGVPSGFFPASMPAYYAPVTPAMILTNIVRITGAIPDFARSGPPAVTDRLLLWKQLQSSTDGADFQKMERQKAALASLLEIAPYETLAIALAPEIHAFFLPQRLNYVIMPANPMMQQQGGAPPVDPLLLLAVLTDLCGQDDVQDGHFAKIIAESDDPVQPGQILTIAQHLTDILTGPTALKPIAHELLQKMLKRSQNGRLGEAVLKVDPE